MTYEGPPTGYPPNQGPQPSPQDVAPGKGTTRRGGFLGFITSIPGVLTALAGLVSAATGGIGLYLNQGEEPSSGGDTYIIEAAPVPEGDGEVDTGGLDAGAPEASGDDEVTALVTGCLDGNAADCDTLLYMVAAFCYDGDLISCDDLYEISAYGSDYEDYGATCGGRYYDWTYAGDCISAPS